MTNREAFVTSLGMLAAVRDKALTPLAVEGYWIALKDLSADEFAKATERALRELTFMPSPVELRTFAGRAPRDLAAEATLAWDAVRRAMDSLDVYGNPDFGPVVNAVVRNLGGWPYLCEQKLSELEWRRKDFERVYRLWADKDASVIPEGGPLFGYWKNAKVTRIEIAVLPAQPIALPPVETPQAQAMREVVRELADSKSRTEGAAERVPVDAAASSTAEIPVQGRPLPSRETKAPVRISEDEKAAAIARMTEQLAARSVAT